MTTQQTIERTLGDVAVFPIGLGAMPMSLRGRPEEARSVATIHAALDAGVQLVDTADAYCLDETDFGHNERLIAKALRGRRDGVFLATKGGHVRPGGAWEVDGRPEHLREACEASLERLETDRIDLYQLHRPDPKVPFAESVGALRELQDAGKVRWVGLSNVTVAQIEEAESIVALTSVQNQLSLEFPGPIERGEVKACQDRGLVFLPWSPLGGISAAAEAPGRVAAVRAAADRHGVSPQQVALAWLLALSPAILPIPGASRPETIRDSARAPHLTLDGDELAAISAAL
jgi:aryl-alcohol dehydrogenase-like predicted oxidoreductase